MARLAIVLLLFGTAVLAFPQGNRQPSWWPEKLPWPPGRSASKEVQTSEDRQISHPDWIPWPPQHPESIPWPPAGWFPENAPEWWPNGWEWPPQHPEWIQWPPQHPEWIPWPPQHPEGIPWPPAGWFPENAPGWWPEGWEWPPQHPEWIPWPPSHPEWIPWPPSHPEWIPWPPTHPEWIPWPPTHPEWIPWPPSHPESIPWPPQHPEWIPWPPAEWFPEDVPSWWPSGWEWPPAHPDWIPSGLDDLSYVPSSDNRFHLFTRKNPSISQPLVYENNYLLAISNYESRKRTVIIIHDAQDSATATSNSILVPALLRAADVNVVLVDWSEGANTLPALTSFNAVQSGRFVSRFISWLKASSHGDLGNFHLIGIGVGGWNVGFISRVLDDKVGYVTALNPQLGPAITRVLPPLNPEAEVYTEAIYTDVRGPVSAQPQGDANFYANGGRNMPGCGNDRECDRLRAVYYFAESIESGGFTGVECESAREALDGKCDGPKRLHMGGLKPKTGSSGIFYLQTNAYPPFSRH